MGLDGASGSAAETQKLNFEEQPDSRVSAWEGVPVLLPPSPLPWGGELVSSAEATRQVGRGLDTEEGVLRGGCTESLD